jgi:DNA-binding MarR family transcriptional regulator
MNTTELDSILAAATPLGLTSPRKIRTMLHLMEHHQCPMTSLAEKLGTSTAAVTGIIDDLEKLGYVRREYGIQDRRQILLCITLTGRVQCERILNPEPVAA